MTTEIVKQEGTDAVDEADSPELSEVEQKAVKEGWAPKEKWDGAEDEWVPAKAFLKFGEVRSQLKNARQESSQKERVINAMKQFHLQVKEDAKKEVIDTLKKQKREFAKSEDFQKVAEVDAQLDELETNLNRKFQASDQQMRQIEQSNTSFSPEFLDWNSKNSWYKIGETSGLTKEADILAIAYAQANPNIKHDPIQVLKYVEDKIKKLYPEQFENKERERPSPVDDGNVRERVDNASTKTRVRLSEAEKRAAEEFGMTHAEYADGLKKWDKMKGRE